MSDITKIKVNGNPESSYQLYPRNEEFTKRSEGVQPDWNQNDDTKPDHIKNRTHYSKIVRGTIVEEQSININYPETDERYVYLKAKSNIVEGNTYTVILNGVSYECVAWKKPASAEFVLGNGSFNGNDGLGEDVPFACLISEDEFGDFHASIYAADGDYTISVEGDIEEVHTLDEKYLPKSVPLQKDMYMRGLQMVFDLSESNISIPQNVDYNDITSNISLTTWREFANALINSFVCDIETFYFSKYEGDYDEEGLPMSFSLVGYKIHSLNNVPTVVSVNLKIVYNKEKKTVTCSRIK